MTRTRYAPAGAGAPRWSRPSHTHVRGPGAAPASVSARTSRPAASNTRTATGPAAALREGLAARGVRAGWWPAGPLDALLGPCAALDLMACNDSGVMHVAAALGVPTLSFHSLGRPEEWAPRSEAAIALHAERIADIAVAGAQAAAARLLAARPGRGA